MSNRLSELAGRQVARIALPASLATAGTADEVAVFRAPHDLEVVAVRHIPHNAITANGTNYATLSVRNKGTDGTGTDVVAGPFATDTPTTDDRAALAAYELTLSATAANVEVAAGEVLAFNKAVAGSGVAIDGVVEIEYTAGIN